MKENERRRKRTSIGMDPELTQYLEDERLAIMLQNSEFLQELRGNEDFMQTLERGKYTVKTYFSWPNLGYNEIRQNKKPKILMHLLL